MGARPNSTECLVVLPTYNERETLPEVVRAVVGQGYHVLVVDDNSPDGTGSIAEELVASFNGVSVMHRSRKLGLGSAYLAGFRFALDRGYQYVLEMDADGQHDPNDLDRLVNGARECGGVAIGSRYVRGGGAIGWSRRRRVLSAAANLYCRALLGPRLHDWTSGFRCYQARSLRDVGINSMVEDGFSIQIELAFRCVALEIPIVEVPITFRERALGTSKASDEEIRKALGCVWRLKRSAAVAEWSRDAAISAPEVVEVPSR